MKRRKVPENKSCQLSPEPLEFGLLNCFRSITELLLIFLNDFVGPFTNKLLQNLNPIGDTKSSNTKIEPKGNCV